MIIPMDKVEKLGRQGEYQSLIEAALEEERAAQMGLKDESLYHLRYQNAARLRERADVLRI